MLKGKKIILGITGSIAAYKAANLASLLIKQHADVHVVMTKNATEFISPITFETLTGNKCLIETFDRSFEFQVNHVSLAKTADYIIVAPATANIIGKAAAGIADDMLSTTIMASKAKKVFSPAMNTNMYENPIVQDNMKKLESYGYEFIEPQTGLLACKDVGKGKMAEPEDILKKIILDIGHEKDLAGKHILVTAGPTKEAIDPVRFISNHSTGKMGYSIAENAALRGAKVTLISGPVNIEVPAGVELVSVVSAKDMYEEVIRRASNQDIIIKSAAVADYRPANVNDEKTKKKDGDLSIPLTRTQDILLELGSRKTKDQFICGFSMETENMLENSRKKLEKKNLDMIIANNLKVKGAGFAHDTNIVTIITKDKEIELPLLSKAEVAEKILTEIKNSIL